MSVPAGWWEADAPLTFADLLAARIGLDAEPITVTLASGRQITNVTVEAVNADVVTLVQRWRPSEFAELPEYEHLGERVEGEPETLEDPPVMFYRLDVIVGLTLNGEGEW